MSSDGFVEINDASLDIGLERHYDLVVVGTDLTASVVAAGAAFSNRSVLHLDANEHYGSLDDACLTFDQAASWAEALLAAQGKEHAKGLGDAQATVSDAAVLDEVALGLWRQRAAQTAAAAAAAHTQQGGQHPTPNGQETRPLESSLATRSNPAAAAGAAAALPVDPAAVAALRRRLRLVRLNQTPDRRARLLSCGASPFARLDPEAAAANAEARDIANAGAGTDVDALSPTPLPSAEGQPNSAHSAPDLAAVPIQGECEALVTAAEQKARLSVGDLQMHSRRWCLDLGSPCALLASGDTVGLLVGSGVGRYLEFMAVQTLSVAGGSSEADGSVAAVLPVLPPTPATLNLWNVPCSKRDIFSSSALSMLEKNRLMKLLRCALDWGTRHVALKADLSSQNDHELALGRALSRPQNGPASNSGSRSGGAGSDPGSSGTTGAGAAAAAKDLGPLDPQPFVARNAPFVEYLAAWQLPPRLRDAVLYGIALLPHAQPQVGTAPGGGCNSGPVPAAEAGFAAPVTTGDGLAAVFRHLSALGVHGETAFLAPLYGSGELAQAFCRLCAIHRGTYLLRHALFGLVLEAPETEEGEDASTGGDGAGGRGSSRVAGVCDEAGFVVACDRFAAADDYLRPPGSASPPPPPETLSSDAGGGGAVADAGAQQPQAWTVRRVAIVDGPVGLRVAALRPNSPGVGNSWGAIQVLTADETTYACPAGLGASILHLTTTVVVAGSEAAARDAALAVAGAALAAAAQLLSDAWGGGKEVWHLAFALPLAGPYARPPYALLSRAAAVGWPPEVEGRVRGGLALPRLPYSLDPHPQLAAARRAFAALFPGDEPAAFLAPDAAAQRAQAEARGEATGDLEELQLAAALAADAQAEALRSANVAAALHALEARVEALEAALLGRAGGGRQGGEKPARSGGRNSAALEARLAVAEVRMAELLVKLG